MGSLIMKRSWWNKYPFDERYNKSCWAHVARMMQHIPDEFRLKFIKPSLQLKRGDNDSFMDKGLVHRYAIAIDGFHRIGDEIFGHESIEAYHLRRVIVNEFPPKAMFYTKIGFNDSKKFEDAKELDRLVKKAYSDKNFRNSIYIILYNVVPMWLYKLVRYYYRFLKTFFNSQKSKTR
jgi:abequosyltransferase